MTARPWLKTYGDSPATIDPDRYPSVTALARVACPLRKVNPLGRMGQPEEIGEVAVWLLSEHATLVTGAHINAGGGGFNLV